MDPSAAVVGMLGDRPRVVDRVTTSGERITGIELIADPARVRELDLEVLTKEE